MKYRSWLWRVYADVCYINCRARPRVGHSPRARRGVYWRDFARARYHYHMLPRCRPRRLAPPAFTFTPQQRSPSIDVDFRLGALHIHTYWESADDCPKEISRITSALFISLIMLFLIWYRRLSLCRYRSPRQGDDTSSLYFAFIILYERFRARASFLRALPPKRALRLYIDTLRYAHIILSFIMPLFISLGGEYSIYVLLAAIQEVA